MPVVVQQVGGIFEQAFDPKQYEFEMQTRPSIRETFPHFDVQCLVAKFIPPRDPRWEYERDMGSAFLDDILNYRPNPQLHGTITFFFPERWMSVHEEQAFTYVLNRHPDFVARVKLVQIITKSPMIISGLMREQIRILSDRQVSLCVDDPSDEQIQKAYRSGTAGTEPHPKPRSSSRPSRKRHEGVESGQKAGR